MLRHSPALSSFLSMLLLVCERVTLLVSNRAVERFCKNCFSRVINDLMMVLTHTLFVSVRPVLMQPRNLMLNLRHSNIAQHFLMMMSFKIPFSE